MNKRFEFGIIKVGLINEKKSFKFLLQKNDIVSHVEQMNMSFVMTRSTI